MEEDRDYIPDDTNLGDIKDTIESLRDQLEEINESLKERSDVGGLLVVVVVIAIIILPSSWAGSKLDRFSDRVWYSQKYDSNGRTPKSRGDPLIVISCMLQSEPNAAPIRSGPMYLRRKSDRLL